MPLNVKAHPSLILLVIAAACGGATSPDVAGNGTSSSSGSTTSSSGSTSSGSTGNTNTPTVCTSGTTWSNGNRGSTRMHPGVACIDCHTSSNNREAPSFTIAGTVYPTAHEPADCNGLDGTTDGVQVVITDAKGKKLTLDVNDVGNFSSVATLTMPYTAKVVSGSKERVMSASQTTGDCNSCHTESGASGAPGRIMAP